MISIKKVAQLVALSALLLSFALQAKEVYVCKDGNLKRQINISYDVVGESVPCQVVYTKEDGTSQNLWNAQNAEGYCEQKADEFAEKQRGWGWDCQAAIEPEAIEQTPSDQAVSE
jgi:hypothetical protein